MSKEKKLGGFSLFSLWAGAAASIAEIMTGSLLAPLGMSKGILVILAGHFVGCLFLAAVGAIGFIEKQPTLVSSRASLGIYGSYVISAFNIIQLVGWMAIMLIQCTRSVQAVTWDLLGINSFTVLLIVTAVLVGLWALYADKGISLINNIAVVLLLVLSAVMLSSVIKIGEIKPVVFADAISVGSALELAIIMPLSWVPLISDYTMSAKSAKGGFWGSFLGYFIGSSFMYIIGLVAAIYAGVTDPIAIFGKLGMGYSALFVIIFSTVTTTFLDVYSAAISTTNLVPGVSKKLLIVVFTVLGTLLALCFPMEQYQNFLYMIGSIFAPVFSVVILDYFIFKKDWRDEAVNFSGMAAAVIGTIFYYFILKYDLLIGSTIPSMAVTAAAYAVIRFITKNIGLGDREYVEQDN